MKNTFKLSLQTWITILLAISVIVIIVVQIWISSIRQLSNLETSLFSILQFLLSLGFAILLARISFRMEFINSQRKFAISAFRRIKEIDMTIERVIKRLNSQMIVADESTVKELDVMLEITRGIRQSIKSSIADWTDIIGEEIETIQKIESLNTQEELISEKLKDLNISKTDHDDKILKQLEGYQKEILSLINKLPLSLQISANKLKSKKTSPDDIFNFFQKQINDNNYLEVKGFWDKSFDRDILDFKVGDQLTVQQGDVGKRTGAMIAYDNKSNSVGVIINSSYLDPNLTGLTYSEYFNGLISFIGRSKFKIELMEIEQTESGRLGRHYFNGRIIPDNKSTRKKH